MFLDFSAPTVLAERFPMAKRKRKLLVNVSAGKPRIDACNTAVICRPGVGNFDLINNVVMLQHKHNLLKIKYVTDDTDIINRY